MCKQIRIALQTVLPKKNNLLVVNTLTKKMRQVLVFDVSSQRGERILANAMATEVGRQQLQGYHFNPEAAISLTYTLAAQRLQVDTAEIIFPEYASYVGAVALAFGFDFENAQSQLVEGERQFYSQEMMPDVFDIKVPVLEEWSGVAFVILEIKFYTEDQGSYVPVEDDRSAVVMLM
jgi:ribosomal protein L18